MAESITETRTRHFLLQNLVQEGDNYRWRINLGPIKNSLVEISDFPTLESVRFHHGPSLFLVGENSDYIRPEHHPVIEKYFSNVEIHCIDNAGHWLHIDQPNAVLGKIRAFL